jgi:ribonuclease VapC
MVIDTSALVALLAEEPDAPRIAAAIERAEIRRIPAIVRLEAAMVLASVLDRDPDATAEAIDVTLDEARFASIAIDDAIARAAVSAFSRYGKGRGHRARLNLADCLVYAAAKSVAAPLLFIGDDFTHTDIAGMLDDPRPTAR